jgi:hypothetical protein
MLQFYWRDALRAISHHRAERSDIAIEKGEISRKLVGCHLKF